VPGHREYRNATAARLQRHDRALLRNQRLRRGEHFDDLLLAQGELFAQLGRERSAFRRTAQLAAVEPDLDVAPAQLGEE
jgi:hypothetical protein